MSKCNCYKTIERLYYTPFYTQAYYKTVGICNGTKECEECSCGGDETKCDFYPEVRERALQSTLVEYDFKIGDVVITDTGKVGIIESICDCDRCKKRGFYEPKARVIDSDDMIYITDTCKKNGFLDFYQIGKYKFGNIDRESVENSIKWANNSVKESIKNLKEYKKQLKRVELLECRENLGAKDSIILIGENGDLELVELKSKYE